MQLENKFTVPVPIDQAWHVLTDIERIAPCMPGAVLDSVNGDDFTGRVKVKLGPINLTYQGHASFVEKDADNHRAVIDARGKDQRGNGTAAAVITAKLNAEGDSTVVDVITDLAITGRPAQFGRGVMTDVGNKLLGQFADKLAAQLGAPEAEAPAVEAPAAEAAATVTGAAEEVAASAEQVQGEGAAAQAVKKTAAAATKAAAAATEKAEAKAAPAKAAPAKKAPSAPPAGTTAPPPRPATGAPAKVAPAAPAAGPARLRPAEEPEPIDLLEVAGGAAMARFALPLLGAVLGLILIIWLVRRSHR